MKKIINLFIFLLIISMAGAQNPEYDKALADSLGADEYGMKSYILVILKTGPAEIENKELRDSIFKGHMETIQRLAKDGKLVVAGPLKKNDKTYRGIYILDVTMEEVDRIMATDPAVMSKIFEYEAYGWYGSAALPLYLKMHDRIEKKHP